MDNLINIEDNLSTLIGKSEIEAQVATAHKYPRSIKRFRDETFQMVTLDESIASECVYSIPRNGKNIEGPSARFAEIIISSWGNCRCGARVVSEEDGFVIAQGVFHDLERNSAINYEVRRKIIDKKGRRFSADMVAVTANAACSIALRNAALKGIPKAFWSSMYESARHTIMGDIQTLSSRRAKVLEALLRYGVTNDIVYRFLSVEGIEDITLEHMSQLFGLGNALKEGETTVEKIVSGIKHHEKNKNEAKTNVDDLVKTKKKAATNKEKTAAHFTFAEIEEKMKAAENAIDLDEAMDLGNTLPNAQKALLKNLYQHLLGE